MNIIFIIGITILFTGGTDSLIEDTKSDKSIQQRILLRKLLNFQDAKLLTWNEVLADVLVNKIRIFSFKNEDNEVAIKNDAPVTKERTVLTNFLSQIFVVYKKFIYDSLVGKKYNADNNYVVNIMTITSNTTNNDSQRLDAEEVYKPNGITFSKGPKSEVELVEPKYHGKITLEKTTTTVSPSSNNNEYTNKYNVSDGREIVTPESNDNHKPNSNNTEATKSDKEYNSNAKEESINCAEGYVRDESGNCVTNSSRLILAIPNQCPRGYRRDWLGNCRLIFHF